MESPKQKYEGLVAVLDALGASSYSGEEVEKFLQSREIVLALLDDKAEHVWGDVKKERVSVFTFNDTIVITLKSKRQKVSFDEVRAFFELLRKFMLDSIIFGILFRGVVSIGTFHTHDDTHTVMGQAVTDAAAWYNKANWFGIHATPHATIQIQRLLEESPKKIKHLLVDYDVPMSNDSTIKLKALNWPKGFFVPKLYVWDGKTTVRGHFLEFLSEHRIPVGVEAKFFKAIEFFDYIIRTQNLVKKIAKTTKP